LEFITPAWPATGMSNQAQAGKSAAPHTMLFRSGRKHNTSQFLELL